MSKVNKKEVIEDERKKIFAKPIVTANPTFELKQIEDFYTLFNLYADNRRQADVREIVSTAKTLGYDQSHEYIFKGLVDIADQFDGEWIGFEQFLEALTHTVGHGQTEEGRREAFSMLDREGEGRITFTTMKKVSVMLKMNMNDDQVQEAIQTIAGKGKQSLTWEQFNVHLAKKFEKKN